MHLVHQLCGTLIVPVRQHALTTAVPLTVTLPAFDSNGTLQKGAITNTSLGPLNLVSVVGTPADSTVYLNVSLPTPLTLNASTQSQVKASVQTRTVRLLVVLTVAVRRCSATGSTDAAALQQAGQLINLNAASSVCGWYTVS